MDGNGQHNPTLKGQAPSTTLTLSITFDQLTGAIGVNGPIQNPLVCYGMLEMARQAIQNFAQEQAQRKIQPVSVMPRLA